MYNRKTRLAIIHLAKKQTGIDEEAYRAVLSGAGVSSAGDIATDRQFNLVMDAFTLLGFSPARHGSANKYRSAVPGTSPGMISRRQERYIKGLWDLASRAKDERSLRLMIKRIGKVDNISFLSRRNASAVILALRDICWKAGYNPDSKEGSHVTANNRRGAAAAPETPSCVLPGGHGIYRGGKGREAVAAGAGSGGEL